MRSRVLFEANACLRPEWPGSFLDRASERVTPWKIGVARILTDALMRPPSPPRSSVIHRGNCGPAHPRYSRAGECSADDPASNLRTLQPSTLFSTPKKASCRSHLPARISPRNVGQVGAVETRFRRKCMTLLLALCPLVVGKRGLPPPPPEEGTRRWVLRRLAEARGEGAGVAEAVRVFEGSAVSVPATSGAGPAPGRQGLVGERYLASQADACAGVATAADCYAFACETGIITADELFLGHGVGEAGVTAGSGGSGGRASSAPGKKRKADGAEGGGEAAGGCTMPRVLRSAAMVTERYGGYLESFPFQCLVDGDEAAEASGAGRAVESRGEGHGVGGSRPGVASGPGSGCYPGRPAPLDDPSMLPSDRAMVRLSRAVLLRRCFNLMAMALVKSSSPGEMAAVLVKEGLWDRGMHLLVVYSLAWPWAGGLLPRASDGDEVEICESFVPSGEELGEPGELDTFASVAQRWIGSCEVLASRVPVVVGHPCYERCAPRGVGR